MHDLVTTSPDQQVRQHLLNLSSDLCWLAKADSKPASTLLTEPRSKFNHITAAELTTGGRFLGYFNVPERRRMAVMSGESRMATIQETVQRICKAASVNLADTDIIFSDTPPKPWQFFPAHAHHLRAVNCPLDSCDDPLRQADHSVTLVVRGNPQNVCNRPVVGNADAPLGETERVAE